MSYKVKPYRTGPGSGERWFGVFDDDGKRIAGGWQDGNSFDGLSAEQAANRWLTNMGEQKNELIYTQAQLDSAIAKAVRERTLECADVCWRKGLSRSEQIHHEHGYMYAQGYDAATEHCHDAIQKLLEDMP